MGWGAAALRLPCSLARGENRVSSDWYEVLAVGARYWFALLGVLIVWRALRWQISDNRRRAQVLRNLPDAGYIGTLYVMEGESDALDEGDSINIPAEGVLGSAMGCDVFLPHPSVSARHVLFHLFADGLHVRAYKDQTLVVDGQVLLPGEQAILRHGAVLTIGAVVVQLRLFVGVTLKSSRPQDAPLPPPPAGDAKARKKPFARRPKTQPMEPPEAAPLEEDTEPPEQPWDTGQWQNLPGWGNPFDENDDFYDR